MFKEKFQGKLVSVYHSVGSSPLTDWLVQCKEGEISNVQDEVLKSTVLQILSPNIVACSITTPVDPRGSLNIRWPNLTIQMKNLTKHYTFEITVLDAENIRRRFRVSSYQTVLRKSTFACSMPVTLSKGWNSVQFNLAQFTQNFFGTAYSATVRVSVHANCRLRRVYFSDRLYDDKELPDAFHLYRPVRPRAKLVSAAPMANKKSAKKASAKEASAKEASAKEAPAKEAPAKEANAAPAKEANAAPAKEVPANEAIAKSAAEVAATEAITKAVAATTEATTAEATTEPHDTEVIVPASP